jgi:type 1 glutamine amidotransferase
VEVKVADRNHPITAGLADFTIRDETYNRLYVAPEVHVLLTTSHPKNDSAVAWTHQYGKSRVFFFQLGHDSKAWKCPSFPQVVARGIRWAAGR